MTISAAEDLVSEAAFYFLDNVRKKYQNTIDNCISMCYTVYVATSTVCTRRYLNIMKIILKNKSDVPIYEQIEEQFRAQILDGRIAENEQLPSIRQLARDLKISVITTTRVYNDLAEEGFIVSEAGKGYFVAPRNNELLRERMLCEMEEGLEKAVISGKNAGLSDEEIVAALKEFMEGYNG